MSFTTRTSGAPLCSTIWMWSLSEHWPSSTALASTCWHTAADWPATTSSRLRFSASKNFFSMPTIWGVLLHDNPVDAYLIGVMLVSTPVGPAVACGCAVGAAVHASDTSATTS